MMMNRNDVTVVQPRSAPPESLPPESLADCRLVAPPTSVPSAERRDYDHSHHQTLRPFRLCQVRPRLAPSLRVGFITPNLLFGGVEHWLLGLLRHSGPRLSWSVAVTIPPRSSRRCERRWRNSPN